LTHPKQLPYYPTIHYVDYMSTKWTLDEFHTSKSSIPSSWPYRKRPRSIHSPS